MSEIMNSKFKTNIDLVKLEKMLGSERFNHTKLVLKAALELADALKIDKVKVEKAALLHDIAKNRTVTDLKIILEKSNWKVDDLEYSIPPILHAPAGAVIAEKEFDIKDQEILEAIRYHSLGHPKMSKLAQVIYAADFISEDRNFAGLDNIRYQIKKDFNLGLYLIVTHIQEYQLSQGNLVHPFSNALRNKLLKRSDL